MENAAKGAVAIAAAADHTGACVPPIGASFSINAGQIATDAGGNVFVIGGVPAVGAGIFKISADGAKCTVVSFAGSSLDAQNRRGRGPDWSTALLQDLVLRDGALFALDPGTRAIYKVDVTSGDREIVTRDNTPGRVGSGPHIAQTGFDRLPNGRFVTQDNELVVLVDPQSGNRTQVNAAASWGPTRWRIWAIPGRKLAIAAVGLGFRPATRTSSRTEPRGRGRRQLQPQPPPASKLPPLARGSRARGPRRGPRGRPSSSTSGRSSRARTGRRSRRSRR